MSSTHLASTCLQNPRPSLQYQQDVELLWTMMNYGCAASNPNQGSFSTFSTAAASPNNLNTCPDSNDMMMRMTAAPTDFDYQHQHLHSHHLAQHIVQHNNGQQNVTPGKTRASHGSSGGGAVPTTPSQLESSGWI